MCDNKTVKSINWSLEQIESMFKHYDLPITEQNINIFKHTTTDKLLKRMGTEVLMKIVCRLKTKYIEGQFCPSCKCNSMIFNSENETDIWLCTGCSMILLDYKNDNSLADLIKVTKWDS